ncbi:MATE family efflux transporter [Enterococcus timonensis]|uniref:MATE family efflux transporter n=1 Tax=Enterococcus timonensis TaxID=1852364 RepID=UPI001F1DB0B8|nr:MATE family efflux transporter [Enterococcus timonensis]
MLDKLKGYFSGTDLSYKDVTALLIPVIIDQFFLVSFNFINTAMISSSGTAAISAVNMVGTLNVFMVQLFAAMGLGGTVLISQAYGRKAWRKISENCLGAIYGAFFIASLLTIVVLVFHKQVLGLLFGDAEQAVLNNAEIYLTGILISYPMQAIVEGTNGSLRGVGRTRSSLKLSLLMNSIYIVMNFIFVFGLQQGVLGLVISLNISRFAAMIFAFVMIYLHRDIFHLRLPDFLHVKLQNILHVITVSIPFAAETMFFNGGKIIVQTLIVSLGTNVIATNAIGTSWVQMSEIIPAAMQTALVPIVGQCIGRKNIQDARKLTKSFVIAGSVSLLATDLLMLPFFHLGMKLFNPPAEILPNIFQIILIALVMHPITWSISFILPSALRAAGDAKFTTTVSLISMWVVRVGIGYLVGIVLGFGLPGIFFVMTVEWGFRGSIFLLRYRGDKWHQKEVL